MTRKYLALVVSHTHWDREWYYSVEQYRSRLIRCLDSVLDIIASEPTYHSFFFDGQTIGIDDYLAVRPERRSELEAAVRAGKLLIGPWLVQADEFKVAGEACLRNMEFGMRRMRELGQENRVGYLVDNFGHISQMPQILRGFGIDNAVFLRGFRAEDLRAAEQTWRGTDGSEVIAVCLVTGYYNAANIEASPDDKSCGGPVEPLAESIRKLKRCCRCGPLLLMNGIDHGLPTGEIRRHLDELGRAYPDVKFRHASLSNYLDKIRGRKLARELGDGELTRIVRLDSTGSARMRHKLANTRVEDLLIDYAEPLCALAAWNGRPVPPGLLRRAWHLLVLNHAHDSISGAHADNVARDVAHRFRRVEEIGRDVVANALTRLVGESDEEAAVRPTSRLWVYDPCDRKRSGPVEIELDLPPGADSRRLSLLNGQEKIPFQKLLLSHAERLRTYSHANPEKHAVLRVRLLADLRKLKPLALSAVDVRLGGGGREEHSDERLICAGGAILDNGMLRVTVHRNGTLDIANRRDGTTMKGLNLLSDMPTEGDLFQIMLRRGVKAHRARAGIIKRTENGPLRAAFRVRTSVETPGRPMSVEMVISLAHGESFVRVRLTVNNRERNHLLSVAFPVPSQTNRDWVHTPFDVVTRQAVRPRLYSSSKTPGLAFDIAGTRNVMQSFVASHGRKGTLYFLSKGEYEYVHERGGPLSVSLLRAGSVIFDFFSMLPTENAQCLGKTSMEYAIGVARQVTQSGLIRKAREFRLAPAVRQTFGPEAAAPARQVCAVLPEHWVLSSIKESAEGDRLVVRLFSLSDRPNSGRIVFHVPVRKVTRTRLDERPLRTLRIRNGTVRLSMRPREIVTLVLEK